MDEPSMGRFSIFVNEIFDIIKEESEVAQPFFWLSRTPKKPFPLLTERMFWKGLSSGRKADDLFMMNLSRKHIWRKGGIDMDQVVITIARQYGSAGTYRR